MVPVPAAVPRATLRPNDPGEVVRTVHAVENVKEQMAAAAAAAAAMEAIATIATIAITQAKIRRITSNQLGGMQIWVVLKSVCKTCVN
jgi:hypothetical protein